MALEYFVFRQCPVYKKLGLKKFRLAMKERVNAAEIWRLKRAEGLSEEEIGNIQVETISFFLGFKRRRIDKFKKIIGRVKKLHALQGLCEGCPSHTDKTAFSCYGAINYPISAMGEKWLMYQFKTHVDPEESHTMSVLSQNKIDGRINAQARRDQAGQPIRLFEASQCVSVTFGSADIFETTVTSDQLFQLMFSIKAWEPPMMLNFLAELGAVDRAKAKEEEQNLAIRMLGAMAGKDLSTCLSGKDAGPGPFLHEIKAGEDLSIAQIKSFLKAMYTAYTSGTMLASDG